MATVSFWEREEFLRTDVCIVGAGIIGLSLAAELLERHSLLRVLVLERAPLPFGASTKNAGFACLGSPTELLRDIAEQGSDAVCRLVADRKRGLERLRERVGDETMGFEPCGGYELLWGRHSGVLDKLGWLNELLQPILGGLYAVVRDELIGEFGFGSHVEHLVHLPAEGALHPGQLLRTLWRLVVERGALVLGGIEVTQWHEHHEDVELVGMSTAHGELRFRARAVALCTNALAPTLTPCLSLRPGRGQVLITEPLEELRWSGVFHFDEGYFYFRNVGKRILFGGGRNLDFEREATDTFALTEQIQQELEYYLRTLIAPGTQVQIAHRWAGIMGFRTPPLPAVQWCSSRVVAAFGCNGMGVALGSVIAERAAEELVAVLA